jgi:hypothetical protein
VADLALQQSIRRSPVPASAQPTESQRGGAPLTYYFILQNVLSAAQHGVRAVAIGRLESPAARSAYYVIFVKNYPILPATRPPVVTPVIGA